VPAVALLICCYQGKTISLTKILERFPYVQAEGAFDKATEVTGLLEIDLGFLDTPLYKDEVLPAVTGDDTPL